MSVVVSVCGVKIRAWVAWRRARGYSVGAVGLLPYGSKWVLRTAAAGGRARGAVRHRRVDAVRAGALQPRY